MEISLENLYVDIGIKGLRDLLSKTLGYQKNQYDWFQRSLLWNAKGDKNVEN